MSYELERRSRYRGLLGTTNSQLGLLFDMVERLANGESLTQEQERLLRERHRIREEVPKQERPVLNAFPEQE